MNVRKGKGLGRGLDALIPPPAAGGGTGLTVVEIPLPKISPNPDQPRQEFDAEALEGLAASIKEHGVIQPVMVTGGERGYTLVYGERRWRAAKLAGITTIPAIVKPDLPADRTQLFALVENLQRADLNPVETALALRRLIEASGLSHERCAEVTGLSRTHVTNLLGVLDLPTDVQILIAAGDLSLGHAKVLKGLKLRSDMALLARRAADEGLPVRALEELAQARLHKTAARQGGRAQRRESPALRAVRERIEHHLGTRVELRSTGRRGRIVITWVGEEDLERILSIIGA